MRGRLVWRYTLAVVGGWDWLLTLHTGALVPLVLEAAVAAGAIVWLLRSG